MKDWILRLVLLIGIGFAPLLAHAQPGISEMTDCHKKMMAFWGDLIDLGKYNQGHDKTAALTLIDVANEYAIHTDHIQDLLFIITLIKNQDDRSRVTPVVSKRMKQISRGIKISLKEVNLAISLVRSSAIVSTGNQMKAELRKLQDLLLPTSTE